MAPAPHPRPRLRRSASPVIASRAKSVIGIDASLTSTGIAFRNVRGELVASHITTDKLRGPHRLCYIRNQIIPILDAVQPDLVVLEDYAMGIGGKNSRGAGKTFHIGELGGVLKALIWDKGYDLLLVSPTTMKSIIARHGHAEKAQIAEALYGRFGMVVTQNDAADAAGLMVVGEMKLGVIDPETRSGKTDRFQSVRESSTIPGRPQRLPLG